MCWLKHSIIAHPQLMLRVNLSDSNVDSAFITRGRRRLSSNELLLFSSTCSCPSLLGWSVPFPSSSTTVSIVAATFGIKLATNSCLANSTVRLARFSVQKPSHHGNVISSWKYSNNSGRGCFCLYKILGFGIGNRSRFALKRIFQPAAATVRSFLPAASIPIFLPSEIA